MPVDFTASPPSGAADPHDHAAPWHDVRVHWPNGTSHLDGIRGWDRQHAVDNAHWNWGTANPHGTCDRIEYLGVADQTDESEHAPPDWWADAPLADEARVRLQLDGYDVDDDSDVR